MKVLMTGFEPFGGEEINPSWEAVQGLREIPDGLDLMRLRLPVSFREAPRMLREAVEAEHPAVVISVGQAGGREGISLERIAVNLRDARIPDNEAFQPVDEPLQAGGPAAYFSSLPLRDMEAALQQAGIAVHISNTAGLYVCNAVFYEAAGLQAAGIIKMAGFIHVPFLPEQGEKQGKPFMDLSRMIKALEVVLESIISGPQKTNALNK